MRIQKLDRQIFETVDRVPLPPQLEEKIEAIREQRAEQSQAFFSRHSEQFREQQELIAAFDLYAEPTAELIRKRAARQSWLSVLEIGPGTGPVTEKIVPLLRSGDHFDLVELNESFVRILNDRFQNDDQWRGASAFSEIHQLIH